MNLGTSFHRVTKLFRKHRQQAGPHELYRDWGRVLAGFFGLLIVAALAAGYMYYKVSRGEFAVDASSDTESPTVDREAFRALVESYAQKDQRFSDLKQTPVTVVDPAR